MRQFTVNRFVKVCFLVAVMLAVCGATVANAAVPAVNVPTYVGIFNSNAEQMKELGGRAGRTILYMDLYQQALQAEAETAKWSAMPNGDGTYSYAQTELTGVRVSLTGNPAWSDYTVEASVYMTESLQNQDGTNGGIASLVALNSAAGYLMLDLDYGKQRLTLNRAYNRITVPLASTSYAVQLNTKYTLKIAIANGEIKVYMNGSATPTLSAADSFLTQGVVGFRTVKSKVRFSDVLVTKDGNTLFSDDFSSGAGSWTTPYVQQAVQNYEQDGNPHVVSFSWHSFTSSYNRVPTGADRVAALQTVDAFVKRSGPYLSYIVVGNEPQSEYDLADIQETGGEIPAIEWMKEVAAQIKTSISQCPSCAHLKVGGGAFNVLYQIYSGNFPYAVGINYTNRLFEWMNSDPNIDVVDVHIYAANAKQFWDTLTYAQSRTPKPLISTEWSQAPATKDWGNQAIDAGFASTYGIAPSTLNKNYAQPLVNNLPPDANGNRNQVGLQQWNDLVATVPFSPDFIQDAVDIFIQKGVLLTAYGGGFQYGQYAYDMSELYATRSVPLSATGQYEENAGFAQQFRNIRLPLTQYADSFESGSTSGWTVDSGTWALATSGGSSVLRQSDNTVTAKVYGGANHWADAAITADIVPTYNGSGAVGVMLRYQDANNYYYGMYQNADNTFKIQKVVNGTRTVLASTAWSGHTWPAAAKHTLTFKAVGNTLTLYVDYEQQLTVMDSSLANGYFGLYAYRANTDYDNVTVQLNRVADSFESGNAAGWSNVSGSWAVAGSGTAHAYAQSAVNGIAAIAVGGGSGWNDYNVSADITPTFAASGAIGVMLRYQDPDNYYFGIYQNADNTIKIQKKVSGVRTILASATLPGGGWSTGVEHKLTFSAAGDQLTLSYDGTPILNAVDSSLNSGRFGLYTFQTASLFDDISVIY